MTMACSMNSSCAAVRSCLTAISAQPGVAFEPWLVDNSKLGWRYHLCGTPKRRQKTTLPLLTQEVRDGCVLADSCATSCAARVLTEDRRSTKRRVPRKAHELLENLAHQILHRLNTLPASEGRRTCCRALLIVDLPLEMGK